MTLADGQMLGPYKIVAQLGSGGMATIYKAYHARLDRYVAVKVMHQAFLQDEGFLARFQREAQIVAKLEHPNIVPVYDFAEVDGQPYLVMKFIEGRTLKQINERGGMALDEMLRTFPRLADALDYAHKRGVLHRDIKPSNILLDADGTPYLTDFGLARLAQLGESTLSADILLGTPHYISPEQAMGRRDLDARTDLYSLGVVLYEMVVGRVPFSADTPFAVVHDHIYKPLPRPSSLNPEVTPQVETVLQRALAKDPADRYESASALVSAFAQAVKDSGMKTLNPNRAKIAAEAAEEGEPLADTEPAAEDNFDPFESILLADEIEKANLGVMDGKTVYVDTPPGMRASSGAAADDPSVSQAPSRSGLNITYEDGKIRATLKSGSFDKSWEARIPESWKASFVSSEHAGVDTTEQQEKIKNDIAKAIEDAAGSLGSAAQDIADDLSGKDDYYGDDPASMRKRAEAQIKKRNEFYGHFATYIVVITIMWVIYGFSSGFLGGDIFSTPWPAIVMLGWGSGLAAHGVETYLETGKRAAARVRAVQTAYGATFGPNWRTANRKALRKVRRAVEKPFTKRREFYQHIAVYILINIMLWTIYAFSSGFLGGGVFAFPWPLIVMLGWGMGLVGDGVATFNANRHENAVAKAIVKEQELMYGSSIVEGKSKRKNEQVSVDEIVSDDYEAPVRLTGDGELTESMVVEMDELDRQRRSSKRS